MWTLKRVDSFTLFMVTCVAIFAIIQASAAADSEEIQDQETDQEIQESRRSGRFLRWPLTLATSRLMQIKKRAGPPNSNFGAPPKKIHQRAPLKKREPIRLRLKPSSQLSQSFKNGRKQPFFTAGHAAAKKRLPTNNFILKKQLHPVDNPPSELRQSNEVTHRQQRYRPQQQQQIAEERFFFGKRGRKRPKRPKNNYRPPAPKQKKRPKKTKRPSNAYKPPKKAPAPAYSKPAPAPAYSKPAIATKAPAYNPASTTSSYIPTEVTSYSPPPSVYEPSENVDDFPEFQTPDFPDFMASFMPDFSFDVPKLNLKDSLDGNDSYKPPSYTAPAPAPSYSRPSAPSYSKPAAPTYSAPAPAPSYSKPAAPAPSYSKPAAPAYEQPKQTYKPKPTYKRPTYKPKPAPSYSAPAPSYSAPAAPSYSAPAPSYMKQEPKYEPAPKAPSYAPAPKSPSYPPAPAPKAPSYAPAPKAPSYAPAPQPSYEESDEVEEEEEEEAYKFPAFESYFDVAALEETFRPSAGGYRESFREPIKDMSESSYNSPASKEEEEPTYSPAPAAPAAPSTYSPPAAETTTPPAPASTYRSRQTTENPSEYTPGPIYYKSVPNQAEAAEPVYSQPEMDDEPEEMERDTYDTFYRPYRPEPKQQQQQQPELPVSEPVNTVYQSQILYNTPSIYDDEEEYEEEAVEDYESGGYDTYGFPVAPVEPVEPAKPKRKADSNHGGFDNGGFFSSPSFKSGIMTPDIWEMFNSEWGQKVLS